MPKHSEDQELIEVRSAIVESIRSKKGERIIDLNIDKVSQTVCKHFIICEAQSRNQVQSIAQEIEDQLKKQYKRKAYHKEGFQNGIWILLDFADVVVHVFEREARLFYNLEGLWGDGILTRYES
jgi:ribosome-associated protein